MPDPNDFQGVEALYETPETGNLNVTDDGKAFRVKPAATEYDGPSLSGPMPMYGHQGQKGLGGSIINPSDNGDQESARVVEQAYKPAEVPLTPAQMLAMADQYENQMIHEHNTSMSQGPAVRRLAGGSPETNYNTELTSGAEKAFGGWPDKGTDDGRDYDYRGAFAAGESRGSGGHLPDTFKKPNHETFSNESNYADHGNPGHWNGDVYVPGPKTPQWLEQYMDKQPKADPYSNLPGVTVVDRVRGNKYLSEHEKLRMLKHLQKK